MGEPPGGGGRARLLLQKYELTRVFSLHWTAPTRERKQMEEDSLPPTPVVSATSPLGGVLEKHAGQVPVSHTFVYILSLLLFIMSSI